LGELRQVFLAMKVFQQDLRKGTNCSVNIGSGLSKIHHI